MTLSPRNLEARAVMIRDRDLLLAALAMALFCLAMSVREAPAAEPYFGVQFQANLPTNESQSDGWEAGSEAQPGGALLFGAELTDIVGIETELGWRRSRGHGCNPGRCSGHFSADGRVDLWYGMANLRLQAPTPYVRPYVMAGAGGGYEREDGRASDGTKLNEAGAEFAYQFGGGIRVPIRSATLDLGVRRFVGGDVQHLGAAIAVTVPFWWQGESR